MGLTKKQKSTLDELLEKKFQEKVERFKLPEGLDNSFAARNCIAKKNRNIYSAVHSMMTTFGMSFYEPIAKSIAEPKSEISEIQWKSNLQVSKDRLRKIDEISADIGTKKRKLNIEKEADEILAIPNKNLIDDVDGQIVDFYFKRGKDEYYVDIKTIGPNLPGFISMRKNNLKWIARADKKIHPILALPYNPYAPRPYKKVGSDRMELGKDLLVGKEFWDLVGGSDGCYEDIEESFRNIGYDYFDRILAKAGIK